MARERPRVVLFGRNPDDADTIAVADVLRMETVGGALMLAAAVVALLWANLGPVSYQAVLHLPLGPLDLEHWAADGLLAIFFFVAGLELKRELTVGALSKPAEALVPIVAAAVRHGRPRPDLPRRQPRAARRPDPGLGHPDGHRHRLRPGHPGARGLEAADRTAGLPAHPGHRRRPRLDHRDRDLLLPRFLDCCGSSAPWRARRCGRCCSGDGSPAGTSICRWACSAGGACSAAASTPTVAGVLLGLLTSSSMTKGPSFVDRWEHLLASGLGRLRRPGLRPLRRRGADLAGEARRRVHRARGSRGGPRPDRGQGARHPRRFLADGEG